jgi:hypothetical protein
MAKLIVRTCRADGIQWMVPQNLRTPPNGLMMAGARMQASGERLRGGGRSWGPSGHGASVELTRLEANQERATQLQYCPWCGQKNWTEAKSKVMPRPYEVQVAALQQAQLAQQQALQAQAQAQQQPPPPDPRLQHYGWGAAGGRP